MRHLAQRFMTMGAVWAVAMAVCAEASAQNWLLVYTGGTNHPRYSGQRFSELLYPEASPGPGPVVSGLLFMETHSPSGRNYLSWGQAGPPSPKDYLSYLDTILAPNGAVAAADSVVAAHGDSILAAIMIPYPLGSVSRRPYWDSRVTFVADYLQHADSLFAARGFTAVRLWGFYWLPEAVSPVDTSIVQHFTALVHFHGLKALWIPYFGSPLASRWRDLGFDQAFLQPNFFVVPATTPARLDSALADATAWDMGFEIEFDHRLLTDKQFRGRLAPYLDLIQSPAASNLPAIAVYDGAGTSWGLAESTDPELHALYVRLLTVLRRR